MNIFDNFYVLDIEVFKNYVLVCIEKFNKEKRYQYEIFGPESSLDDNQRMHLFEILNYNPTIGFNSLNYDIPILNLIIKGKKVKQIFEASSVIIQNEDSDYVFQYKIENKMINNNYEHYDVNSVCPRFKGLKELSFLLGFDNIQELPIDPLKGVNKRQIPLLREYCFNDIDLTRKLTLHFKDAYLMRQKLKSEYNIDFMNVKDQGLLESILKKDNKKPRLSDIKKHFQEIWHYEPPMFIRFKNDCLNKLLDLFRNKINFKLDKNNLVFKNDKLSELLVEINNKFYSFGVGGLHSNEKVQNFKDDDIYSIRDVDVASYYPNIMINNNITPFNLKSDILTLLKTYLDKKDKSALENDNLSKNIYKLFMNSVYGKLSSKYSIFLDPAAALKVTLTGQLALLMLIEDLESNGFEVISANTDGVTFLENKKDKEIANKILENWQKLTNFVLTESYYDKIFYRDVNNYVGFLKNGEIKTKGRISKRSIYTAGLPNKVYDMCIQLIKYGKKMTKEEFFKGSYKDYLFFRKSTGGAYWNENEIGKLATWVLSYKGSYIRNKKTDNKVSESQYAYVLNDNEKDMEKLKDILSYELYNIQVNKIVKSYLEKGFINEN